jgi:tetratricopeptide (TPR) repeat protein
MRLGETVAWLRPGLLAVVLSGLATAGRATSVDDAVSLYRHRRYEEARAILEPLAASHPSDAAAAYYLGMTYLREGGRTSLDSARTWIGRAVTLAPGNPGYLADYAGVCLLLADRDTSFSLAVEGRDAMSRAIAADPSNLEACEGLMRFYATAPWPLCSPAKALSLAAQIGRVNPKRGIAAYLAIAAAFEKDGRKEDASSAKQAAQALARDPPP